MSQATQASPPRPLHRAVGVFGASMMGLGSIVGTGVFVSIGVAAGAAGPAVVLAIAVAALVATCNGLSSAQLAANHPVSGGTYEYGYRWLHPSLGFTAGWMFLCAKSASGATAALGFGGYVLNALGGVWGAGSGGTSPHTSHPTPFALILLALSAVVVLTLLVLTGIRRTNVMNVVIVSVTIGSLIFFVIAGLSTTFSNVSKNLTPFFTPADKNSPPVVGFLEACALMFVAYTGYGRIATLGEEIRNPSKNIPVAILVTLLVAMGLYVSVGLVAVAAVGAGQLAERTEEQAAPLEVVARTFAIPAASTLVAVGAVTAMLGVLLNLILGLSRVVLAMGRRGDLPRRFASLDRRGSTPYVAVLFVGTVIAGLALVGDVKTTWSFSAFSVLIYYAVTNLSAIRLSEEERLYPIFIPWLGLFACLFLAFWVEPAIWIVGLGLIAAGLIWHKLRGTSRSGGSVGPREDHEPPGLSRRG